MSIKTRVRWNGKFVSERVRRAAAAGLNDAAEHVLEEANRTVPHEEGTLMRSGMATVDENALRAAVAYDTPYAVRQHEETGYRHAEGRRAKWLELTLQERERAIRDYMADQIRKAMRG